MKKINNIFKVLFIFIGLVFFSNTGFADTSSGLVGHWKLDETSGVTAADFSSNGYTGTLTNSPSWAAGIISGGLSLNSGATKNQYVSLPDISMNGPEMTISVWANIRSASSSVPFIAKGINAYRNGSEWGFWIYAGGNLLEVRRGGSNLSVTKKIDYNSWHHYVAVYSSIETSVYVDGVKIFTGAALPVSNVGGSTGIGGWPANVNLDGTLDDVRLYSRALTSQDVTELYSGSGGSTNPPVNIPTDIIPPVISSISTSITINSALISWSTNESSDSLIEYGLTNSYGSFSPLDTNQVSSHAVNITGLNPSTTYHFRVKSKDAAGNFSFSNDSTFVTSADNTQTQNPPPVQSSIVHPRVLITPSFVASKKIGLSSSSDWTLLKAKADKFVGMSVTPYDSSSTAGITAGYRGANYADVLWTLSMAYQLSGNTAYADKGIKIMEEMDRAGLCIMLSESKDSAQFKSLNCTSGKGDSSNGYPIRNYGTSMAIGYDWLYDRLSPSQKVAFYTQLNEWIDWYASYGFEVEATPTAGNFFGGYLEALAFTGFATQGDNPKADTYINRARGLITSTVYTQFSPGGWFYGGNEPEGFAYGTAHFIRLLNAMTVFKTAQNEDLFGNKNIPEQMAKFLIHAVKPNLWQMIDTGEWGGTVGGNLFLSLPMYLSKLLAGTTLGAEMQYMLQITYKNPPVGLYSVIYDATPVEKNLYRDPSRTAIDYRQIEPLMYQAESTKQFISRSDWSDNAVWTSFHGGSKVFSVGHENKDNGSFTIQRGNDYLIVDGSQYRQPDGWIGDAMTGYMSCNENTLFFNDFGDYIPSAVSYCGGQTAGGDDVNNTYENTDQYFYAKIDLTSAYDVIGYFKNPNNKTLLRYERSFLQLRPNLVLVFDQVSSRKATYEKKFRLHFGSQPLISGDTISNTVGSSKVFVKTILPESPMITSRLVTVDRGTKVIPTTWETDSYNRNSVNDDNFLNVIYSGPSTATSMVPTSKISALSGNMQGVYVQNQGEFVVMFNSNTVSTPVQNTTYTLTGSSGQVTHYLFGVQPGANFKIQKNGVDVTNKVSSANGVLQFSATGNGTFTVQSVTGGDVISPVVTITTTANVSVTGSYTFKADASDNVGVAGVQFLLDGNPIGSEVLSAPYQITFDSTTVINGKHSLSARARDINGNVGISSTVSITVSNTVTTKPLPVISSFNASLLSVVLGNSTTLSWSVTGATSLSINQGIGAVTGTSKIVTPGLLTTYTLTATNESGSVTKSVTISIAGSNQNTGNTGGGSGGSTGGSTNGSSGGGTTSGGGGGTPSAGGGSTSSSGGGSIGSVGGNTGAVGGSQTGSANTSSTGTTVGSNPIFVPPLTRTLAIGVKGPDVTELQKYLVARGYLKISEYSDYFGPLTRSAVQKMQCDLGVVCGGDEGSTGYGVLGQKTRQALSVTSSQTTQNTSGQQTTTQVPSTTLITRTLSYGMKGDDILILQKFLISKGYLPTTLTPTTFFGQLTRSAVQKFQCDSGIVCAGTESSTGYGLVGKLTRGRMGN